MSKVKSQKSKFIGYTLIEILVGLTIIGLVFGFGYVNFRDFSRRQVIAGVGKQIQGDLRLAQELALAGQKPKPVDAKCESPNYLNGYDFKVYSGTEYKLEANCSGGTVVNKDVILPGGITMAAPSPNPILFKVLGQGTNIAQGGSTTVVLTQSRTNNRFTVTISSSGEIK